MLDLKRTMSILICLLMFPAIGAEQQIKNEIQQQKLAQKTLHDFILNGDNKTAHMVFAIAIYGKRKGFANVIRQRLLKLSESIDDMKLKAVGLHALAVITDDDLTDKLIPLLNHHNGKVRHAALDATLEAEVNDKLSGVLRERLMYESDSRIKPTVLRSLCRFDKTNKEKYIRELQYLSKNDDSPANIPAAVMLIDLGEEPTFENEKSTLSDSGLRKKAITDALSKKYPSDKTLITMLMSKNHALRIEAVELAAKKGSPTIKQFLLNAGNTGILHLRLASAYYIYFIKDKKQALNRLNKEKNPMVQVLLLGALLDEEKKEIK